MNFGSVREGRRPERTLAKLKRGPFSNICPRTNIPKKCPGRDFKITFDELRYTLKNNSFGRWVVV